MLKKLFEEYSARHPFEKVSNLIYMALLTCITSAKGELQDGFTISEIIQALDVSRTPVVSAIERLEDEGFVRHVKYRGIKICNRQDVCTQDMYLARATLEMRAAELVTNRISHSEYKNLCEIHRKTRECAAGGEVQGLLDTDDEFHSYLIFCSRDPLLQDAYAYLEPYIRRSRYTAYIYTIASRIIVGDHSLILNCIRNGNASMAREAMRIHMQTCSNNQIFDKTDIFGQLRMEQAEQMRE